MADRFLLFTDAPPLKRGGHGCSVLSRNLLEAFGDLFGMVITRRQNAGVKPSEILPPARGELVLFPDAPRMRPRRFRAAVDFLLFVMSLPALRKAAKRSGCHRIFALFGADSWFLPKVELLRRVSGLPLDIYLVDDLEASCRLGNSPIAAQAARWGERRVLQRAERVFVISPAYVEHLRSKYDQAATWLPLLAEESKERHVPYRRSDPDVRSIAFLGSLNALYFDGLIELNEQIDRWNRSPEQPYGLRVTIYTRHAPAEFLARLPHQRAVEIRLNADEDELQAGLQAAWAIFLPYSFDAELRTMVTTSFSHKFTESVAAGRPILVYGPDYASLPHYFQREGLPLCATSPAGLQEALVQIKANDHAGLVERYRDLVRKNHSPAAVRRIITRSQLP